MSDASLLRVITKKLGALDGVPSLLHKISRKLRLLERSVQTRTVGEPIAADLNEQIELLSAAATREKPARIYIPRGNYTMLEPIVGASNVWIECDPDAYFDFTAVTGTAPYDDPTVCAVSVVGVVSTDKINTTLNGSHYPGDRTITVLDVGTAEAGDWILIETLYGGLMYKDKLQIESVLGNVITTTTGLRVEHTTAGTGLTVKQITPVENFRWTGGFIDARGGTLAAAFHFSGALDCRVDAVRWAGFTRAAVCLQGATESFESADCYLESEANSSYWSESSHDIVVEGYRTNPHAALRQHAVGYTRHQIIASHGTGAMRVQGVDLRHIAAGVRFASGYSLKLLDSHMEDLDPARLLSDGFAADDLDGENDQIGVALTGGYATIEKADFPNGVTVSNLTVKDVFCRNLSTAIAYHDWRSANCDNVQLENLGQDPAVRRFYGIRVDDILTGNFTNHHIKGIERGLVILKTPNGLQFDNWTFNGTVPGGNCQVAVEFALTPGYYYLTARYRGFRIGNYNTALNWANGHDGDQWSEWIDFSPYTISSKATEWYNAGAAIAHGTCVSPTSGGTHRRITTASAGDRYPMVMQNPPGTSQGFVLCAFFEGTLFALASGSVSVGTELEVGTGGILIPTVGGPVVAVAQEPRSGGGSSLINVRGVL